VNAVIPVPFSSLPADIVAALRTLPRVMAQLDAIRDATQELIPMRDAITGVAKDTRALPNLERDMATVAEATRPLAEMRDATTVLPTMDERMATIERAMPALAEVQQSLAALPDTMDRLGDGLTGLSALLEQLLGSLNRLDENVQELSVAVQPLGRIAERLPGGSRR
jgi:ABC-type transporter Mla subunit MlaD